MKTDNTHTYEHNEAIRNYYERYAMETLKIELPMIQISPNPDQDGLPDVNVKIIDVDLAHELRSTEKAVVYETDVEYKAGTNLVLNVRTSQVSNARKTYSMYNRTTGDQWIVEMNPDSFLTVNPQKPDNYGQYKFKMKTYLTGTKEIKFDMTILWDSRY